MRRTAFLLATLGVAVCASATPATHEPGTVGHTHRERVLTRAALPPDHALAGIGLKKQWYIQVPVESLRDGVATVQVFGPHVVVRTYSGQIMCLDAETGATLWRTYMGKPYPPYVLGVGANEDVFLAMADLKMYGLNRRNGNVEWVYGIPGTPITHPAADKYLMFLGTNEGRVRLLQIPQPPLPIGPDGKPVEATDKPKGIVETSSKGVVEVWSLMLDPPLPQPPIFTSEFIVFVDGLNHVGSYDREKQTVIHRFVMRDRPAAPMVSLGDMVYVASRDRTLYALEMDKGFLELHWSFIADGTFVQRPSPIDNDLFIGVAGSGVYCFDRASGAVRWKQPQAERFLSASHRLVFAVTADKRLLMLDRARGLVLAQMDIRSYAYGVHNLYSDRFLLVSHDGTLVCMRDASKASEKPARYQVPPPKKAPALAAKPKPPEDKGEEEEKPKKKEPPKPKPPGKAEEEEKGKKKEEMEEKPKKDDKGKKEEEEMPKKDEKKPGEKPPEPPK
jgi:outer membrane protein assembly factor BamB